MAASPYPYLAFHALKGDIDLDTATLKAMLVGSSYTYGATHEFRSDVTGEVTGTGYTAGGVALTSTSANKNAGGPVEVWSDDAAFGTVTITGITGLIVYVDKGSAATDVLVSFHSFASQSPSGVSFTYEFLNGVIIDLAPAA